VTFDSDTSPECRDLFVNQATSDGIAEVQLQMVADQVENGEAQVAILSATANATNQNAWIATMEQMVEENDAYSGIDIVTIAYGDDEDEKSFQEAQGLLQSYPDLDAIIAPTTVGVAAAARYVSGSQYKGDVIVTGLGTPNQMREYVEDGTVAQFALWNPEELGYLAAWTAAALVSGQISGQEGEIFQAGDLGEYEVGADGVVLLGPPTVFDESNIDDFDF
jgi:rhamnose transport system substrate-binding protein